MRKISLLCIFLVLFTIPAFAKITFGNADINQNDEVVFSVKQEMSGVNTYKSLFYAKINDGVKEGDVQILTCYPEKMELLDNGTLLQIRNRYGTARYSAISQSFNWIERKDELPLTSLPIAPYSVSADGKWFCKIEKTDVCLGDLILENTNTGKKVVLNSGIVNSYESVPVKWAPDSSILLYEKKGTVYFCNPDALLRGVEIEEKYRRIGRGTINSVEWASSKNIAYIDDYLLYKINSKELYTVGLYSGIIGQGKPMGRLPFQFNSQSDRFSADSDVMSAVVIQNRKLFSYLKVQSSSCDYMDVIYSRPYTDSSASLIDSYIFWNESKQPIIWQEKLPYNGKPEKGAVYRLTDKAQQVLEIEDSGKPFVSPDGKKIAFYAGSAIYVYDVNTWQRMAELTGEKITSAIWANRNVLYVGGEKTIRKWSLLSGSTDLVCLSSISSCYWDNQDYSIVAEVGSGNYFKYNNDRHTWLQLSAEPDISVENQNGRYRVFTGTTPNKRFENALYVRTLNKKPVTKPLFEVSAQKLDSIKKIALVFDAYDNPDGLSKIIASLKKYNVKGSFFVNGEFISRYPSETKQIIANGYKCSSMFFTTTDLTDNSFVIDEDFIRRGLARNEDEFYQCTGEELTLYWHAPYHNVSPEIISYSENAGYTYVSSIYRYYDFDIVSPQVLIHEYYSKAVRNGGGIIPVTIGFSQIRNFDYLYNHLDLLICSLLDEGFEFVTIENY